MAVLVVIDVQNDFITGSLGSKEAQDIIPNIKNKIKEYIDRGEQVIFTQDTHRTDYLSTEEGKKLPVEHCISGSDGWRIPDSIGYPIKSASYIRKTTFGFNRWEMYISKDVKEIELIGLCTDICVISNALILKAEYTGSKIKVDASCCAGTTKENHEAAIQIMKNCHIDIIEERVR